MPKTLYGCAPSVYVRTHTVWIYSFEPSRATPFSSRIMGGSGCQILKKCFCLILEAESSLWTCSSFRYRWIVLSSVTHSVRHSVRICYFWFDLPQQQNFAQKIIFYNKNVLSLVHLKLFVILQTSCPSFVCSFVNDLTVFFINIHNCLVFCLFVCPTLLFKFSLVAVHVVYA